MNRMIAITIKPGAVTAALLPIAPPLLAATTTAPAATSTRKNVPMASANRRRHSSRGSSKSAAEPNSSEYQARARATARRRDSAVGPDSDAGFGLDTALLDGPLERGVVAFVLVSIDLCKGGERVVEDGSLSEVRPDRDRVARARVR